MLLVIQTCCHSYWHRTKCEGEHVYVGVMMMGGGGLIGLLLAGAFEVPWKSVSKTMIFRGIKTAVSQAAHNVSIPTQRRAIQSSLPCSPWRPGCLIPSDGSGKSTELLSVRVGLQPASPNQVKVKRQRTAALNGLFVRVSMEVLLRQTLLVRMFM